MYYSLQTCSVHCFFSCLGCCWCCSCLSLLVLACPCACLGTDEGSSSSLTSHTQGSEEPTPPPSEPEKGESTEPARTPPPEWWWEHTSIDWDWLAFHLPEEREEEEADFTVDSFL